MQFLVVLRNRTSSNEPPKETGVFIKNKQVWTTLTFLAGALNLPVAFFRLILQCLLSNESFLKCNFFFITLKQGRPVRIRMGNKQRKEGNWAMRETKKKFSKKTISLFSIETIHSFIEQIFTVYEILHVPIKYARY